MGHSQKPCPASGDPARLLGLSGGLTSAQLELGGFFLFCFVFSSEEVDSCFREDGES